MSFEALDVAMHDQVSPEDMQSLQYKLKSAATCFLFLCVCVSPDPIYKSSSIDWSGLNFVFVK